MEAEAAPSSVCYLPIETSTPNPLDQGETCTLLTKKADNATYYKHTYNPGPMLAKLRSLSHHRITEEVIQRFDNNTQDKCCNVISITLYIKDCNDKTLEKYIMSIHRSVKNVLKNLPDWIVRLYLDTTVEECLKKYSEYQRILREICESPNVEIYTYNCSSFKSQPRESPIERTRTFRFLPMSEPDVNLCVVREADGIVSNLDCHNIKMFAQNPEILLYLPVIDESNDNTRSALKFYAYSPWLQIYKGLLEYEYFNR